MGRPAITPQEREDELINLAIDLAEKQLRDGTASPSVVTHYLKLASTRETYEVDQLKKKTEMMGAKTEAIKTAKRVEELYEDAIEAMKKYSGTQDDPVSNNDYNY